MLPFPLKEVRSAMASLRRAGVVYYIFAHNDESTSPPVHTELDLHTASLLSDYLGKVARGAPAEDNNFTILYPEEEEDDDEEIFR